MTALRVAVIPGDGIGPEVTREGAAALEAALAAEGEAATLEWLDWGADRFLATGVALPPGALDDLRARFDAILFGALGDPRVPDMAHGREILLGMRAGLDLYVNLRPARLLDDRLSPLRGKGRREIDLVILRENTEGPYAGVGGVLRRGTADEVAVQESLSTRKGVERILRAAFELARRPGRRRRVCMVDKANALRYEGDLWQRAFAEVGREHADVERSHLYVDVAAMELVRAPERFDVLVTDNLFGDILTDLGAAISGGLGLAASANLHPGRLSLFEPVHGSAPDLVGQGVANPLASMLSVALLLAHCGRPAAARRVEAAVERTVQQGPTTPDLGGRATTREVAAFVLDAIARGEAA